MESSFRVKVEFGNQVTRVISHAILNVPFVQYNQLRLNVNLLIITWSCKDLNLKI